MENVPGLLSAKLQGESTFAMICEDLAGAGYELHPLNAAESPSGYSETDPRRFVVHR